MRIGEFSKLTELSESTIRYYINHGLLGPTKRNGQYSFDDRDLKTAKTINELKELGFSLEDISKFLLSMLLTSKFKNALAKEQKGMLKRRIHEIHDEQKSLRLKEKKLKAIISSQDDDISRLDCGFSLKAIPFLRCPFCGSKLLLRDGTIEEDCLRSASLHCEKCSDSWNISDGILYPNCFSKEFIQAKDRPINTDFGDWGSKKEAEVEKRLIAYQRAFSEALEKFSTTSPKVFLISDIDNSVLLLSSFEQLPRDCLIFVQGGMDLPSIRKVCSDFRGHQVAFIFSDSRCLPLKAACLDGASWISNGDLPTPFFSSLTKDDSVLFETIVREDNEIELKQSK
ncbi:MAG: MerR family transcriptional regulator [Bacilli bacterium]|jgi:DNA-binding transcriptional MerR regulator/uncharacterized protein YbaR (Trm112 family)|nr:MerR family transcriptional regulator [Bacilli bacterium]MCI2111654.1 MerR family transcriptional regulator [Bacilli bacterium]